MKNVSKEVDARIKQCFARLARKSFERALDKAQFGEGHAAEAQMVFVERWLKRAGANATRRYF
jgi:hypothetical protein